MTVLLYPVFFLAHSHLLGISGSRLVIIIAFFPASSKLNNVGLCYFTNDDNDDDYDYTDCLRLSCSAAHMSIVIVAHHTDN